MTVNGKRIKTFDIHASNGVIHLLTDVIYPFIPDQTIAEIVSTDPRLFEEIQIFHVKIKTYAQKECYIQSRFEWQLYSAAELQESLQN